ncbi:MAG: hemerythrin domain-containing protein [Acidobacteriota bacterium]
MVREIDLRTAGDARSDLATAFQSLDNGESMRVVWGAAAPIKLSELQEVCGELMSWSILEDGPVVHRLELCRWASPPSDISTLFEVDHDRLDHLLEGFQQMLADKAPDAQRTFIELRTGLLHHIRVEEELLFPIVDRAPTPAIPLERLRREHDAVKVALKDMAARLLEGADVLPIALDLQRVIGAHNSCEERLFYPAIDARLPEGERLVLLRRTQQIPRR